MEAEYSRTVHVDKTCDVVEIGKYKSNGYKIVCLGAGKKLLASLNDERYRDAFNCIDGIADNDAGRKGQEIKIEENVFHISSPEAFAESQHGILWFLTTTQKYTNELIDQLQPLLKENDRIVLLSELDQNSHRKKLLQRSMSLVIHNEGIQLIPKIIHYCWFGRKKIPDEYRKWMESWKKFCPDYEIVEWNEDNYDVKSIPYTEQAYKEKKYAFVSDYARLDVIYRYGGIYLDTDVELLKNLDPLLFQKGFLCFESDDFVNTGLGYGAERGLQLIKEFRDDYSMDTFSWDTKENCPVKQTRILEKYGLIRNGEFQRVNGVNIYPQPLLNPMVNYMTKETIDSSNSYAIHHFAGSWL